MRQSAKSSEPDVLRARGYVGVTAADAANALVAAASARAEGQAAVRAAAVLPSPATQMLAREQLKAEETLCKTPFISKPVYSTICTN